MGTTRQQIDYLVQFRMDRRQARIVLNTLKQMQTQTKSLGMGFVGLATRAAQVIPVWVAMRMAYMGVFTAIKDGLKYMSDLDKGLARVKAVVHGTSNEIRFMARVSDEVEKNARNLGVSVTDASEAMYRFGTAGIRGEEAMKGMNTALRTSVAMMGNSTTTARALADIYNLVGSRMEQTMTTQDKMNHIGATMAVLWRNNAFELNEFTSSLKNWVPVATNYNLTLDQMMALTAAAHTLMQRGSTAGTQLSRSFRMMTRNIDTVNRVLGRTVNLKTENMFYIFLDVLKKVNTAFGDTAMKANVLTDIFGMKAGRVAQSFAVNLGKVVEELERLDNLSPEERMKQLNKLLEIQMNTTERQADRWKQLRLQMNQTFITGITGAKDFTEALTKINEIMENNMIPTIKKLGDYFTWLRKGGAIGEIFGDIIRGFQQMGDENALIGKYFAFLKKGGVIGTEGGAIGKMIGAGIAGLPKKPPEWEGSTGSFGIVKGKATREKLPIEDLKSDILETEQGQLLIRERLAMLGYSELEIEREKLAYLEKFSDSLKDVEKQQLKILKLVQDEMIGFSNELRKSFEDSFSGLLKGEKADIFKNIGGTIKDTTISNLSKSFTSRIFKDTGIGDMFGKAQFSLSHIFDGPIEGAHASGIRNNVKYITDAHKKGMMTGAGAGAVYAGGGGGGGALGGWFNQPLVAAQYAGMESPASGGFGTGYRTGGAGKYMTRPASRATRGGALGVSALTGYATYQNAQAGGIGRGQSTAAGLLTGAGALGVMGTGMLTSASIGFAAGASTSAVAGGGMMGGMLSGIGSALAAIPVAGWIALAALAVGTILGMSGGKEPSSRNVEVRENTNQITSRIDISNRELAWVNRNLVAMRQELSYILPQSAYFRERNETENFAIGSMRGVA